MDEQNIPIEEQLKKIKAELDNAVAETETVIAEYMPAEQTPRQSNPDYAQEENTYSRKKLRSRVTGLFFYVILITIILALFLSYGDNNGMPRPFGGYAMMRVLTMSMQSEIPKDSLVITKKVDPNSLKVDDDITFLRDEKTTVTHRIIAIYENYAGTGARGFETQGINNSSPDKDIVPAVNLVGKVIFHNHFLGKSMIFIKEYALYIVFFTVAVSALFIALRVVFTRDGTKKEKRRGGKTGISPT